MPIRDFDDLAKAMASRSTSRRDVLKWVGGALLGSVLASIPGFALAQPSEGGRPAGSQGCPIPRQIRVKGRCVCPSDTTLCFDRNECVPNNVCSDPFVLNPFTCSCECPSGTRPCGDSCASEECAFNEIFNPATCQCGALTSPSLLRCFCQDNTEIPHEICTPVNCNSGLAQDEICVPLCAEHGGLFATGCNFDDPSCVTA